VRLVDAQTWAVQHVIDTDGSVDAVVFSPDGKTLALGGGNHPRTDNGAFVQLWVPGDAEANRRHPGWPGKTARRPPAADDAKRGFVTCLAFSPDGKLLAAGDLDGKIRLYDGQTCEPKQVLDEHREMVNQIVFSLDGKTLVSGSYDKTAKLWDVPTAKVRQTLAGIEDHVMAVAPLPGRQAAGDRGAADPTANGSSCGTQHTGQRKHVLPEQTMSVVTLAFAPDSKTLAIGGGSRPDPYDVNNTTGEIILFPLESLTSKQAAPGKDAESK